MDIATAISAQKTLPFSVFFSGPHDLVSTAIAAQHEMNRTRPCILASQSTVTTLSWPES
jgi:hypothetical protein